jgi:hypothetical protein
MPLTLIELRDISVNSELPKKCHLSRAFYLGYGRNAWRSTWTNIYMPGLVSFDVGELKNKAEKLRVQGSVFKIEAIPMLVLRYSGKSIGLSAINDGSKYEYDRLLKVLGEALPATFWQELPPRSQNWMLTFELTGVEPKLERAHESFSPLIYKSKSGGTQHGLGWQLLNNGKTFEQFLGFVDVLIARIGSSTAAPLR